VIYMQHTCCGRAAVELMAGAHNLPPRPLAGVRRCASLLRVGDKDLGSLSDNDLVNRFVERGDRRAFDVLYTRHETSVYRYFLRMGCTESDAADIWQNAWERLWKALRRGQYAARSDASFKAYLFAIARNCRADMFPNQPVVVMLAGQFDEGESDAAYYNIPDPAPQPDATLEEEQLQGLFARARPVYAKALAALPDEQRQALVLTEDGKLTVEEIAEVMNVPFETAKSYIRRAREKLRRRLQEWYDAQK
jgi:RNA polymerase sigma-70 factor, ECF subfamily